MKLGSWLVLPALPAPLVGLLLVPPLPQETGSGTAAAAESAPARSWVVDTFCPRLEGGTGGVEVDAQGVVYVADFGSKLGAGGVGGDRLFRLASDGSPSVFVRGLRGASGNAIGPDGDLFQSSIGGNTISRISPDGEASVFLARELRSPVGIAIDEEGLLFVANCGSNTILEVTPEGDARTLSSDPLLKCPNGIALDPEHALYVANFGNGDVLRVDWEGRASVLATLPGKNNGHLVWHDGFLWVVARSDHRIYRVSTAGEVVPFAGSGERGQDDGPALEASFSFPNDLAFAPDGETLYVNQVLSLTEPHTELAPSVVRRIRLVPAPEPEAARSR